MSETSEEVRRKINGAADLGTVVRTMKALAGSRIGEYQNSVLALQKYYNTIEMGLKVLLKQQSGKMIKPNNIQKSKNISVIVFGSDQGLIGQFNEIITEFVIKTLSNIQANINLFIIGDRLKVCLEKTNGNVIRQYEVPNSIEAITPLVTKMLLDAEKNINIKEEEVIPLFIFYNQPLEGASYEPVYKKILPLDEHWAKQFILQKWPSKNLPEIIGDEVMTFDVLVREYLFVSLFRSCACSLASENASRLAAMQRAEKNINTLLDELNQNFNHIRQNKIDEELFEVVAGFKALIAV